MFGGGPRGPVDNEKFYTLLGVPKDATSGQIKKAYHKKARSVHPDKNQGDVEKENLFKELSHAYEILSDPEKRDIYDKYGEEGLKQGGMGGFSNANDIFSQFFGGGFGGSPNRGPQRGDDISFALGVTLKDLYNGTKKKLRVNKNVICSACAGKGSKKEGATKKCPGCQGRGVKFTRRQMGPSIIQMQQDCDDCNRKGEIIDPKDRCKACKGKKTVKESKIIEVEIDRGMREGQKITFSGEGDQAPGILAGDIVVVLKEKEDDTFPFIRRGDDLILQKDISLLEALTGYEFLIEHMDERTLHVKSKPGDVTEEGSIRVINNEGMPQHRNPFIKGNLFIKFSVKWPKSGSLSKKQIQALEEALPAKKTLDNIPMDVEEVSLEPYDENRHERNSSHGYREAYEEDEGGHTQTCVHQ
uniref:Uncharacterized protein n=1 Tax=Vannella robusta TaxID=1487602 RepID=A0A7S4IEX5_9EUKA|mmetsp:Transcript_24785/g.31546  ORF Transcript_24785/g.31546 Transcript_24785/m.31546 type:complete len:414 (+) Transcript_24785:73-1314(+)